MTDVGDDAGALRIVGFMAAPGAALRVAGWANERGHRLVLVVTTPAKEARRYGGSHLDLIAALPPVQDVLVTTRMKTVAAPVIRALSPDVIISAMFPRLIPPEAASIPRYGAFNIHPSLLPRHRGPNPFRALYDGDPTLGFSFHRVEPEVDAGAVLSQQERPVPDDLTAERLWAMLSEMVVAVLDDGVRRAVAGEPGEPQDVTRASYSPPFTETESWLDWRLPAGTLQRQAVALNFPGGGRARAMIGRDAWQVDWVRPLAGGGLCDAPGTELGRGDGVFTVCAGDGPVEVGVSGVVERT